MTRASLPNLTTVFLSSDRRECMEARLVLEAIGIAAEVSNSEGTWRIQVAQDDRPAAVWELKSYQQERQADRKPQPVPVRVFGGAVA